VKFHVLLPKKIRVNSCEKKYAVRKENEMPSHGFTLVFSPFDWLGIPPPPPPPLGWDGDEE